MEYCGEVVDNEAFHERTQEYHNDGISHYYFMTLKQNEVAVVPPKYTPFFL